MTLADFLLARIAEDEAVAHEASRRDDTYIESGVHWQWEDRTTDEPIPLDPTLEEYHFNASLRSVEQFPTMSVGALPQFAIAGAEDLPVVVAMHIARFDPARVLAECEAKRKIIALHPPDRAPDDKHVQCDRCSDWQGAGSIMDCELVAWPCPTLRILAAPYSDHPDYREEWRHAE